MIDSGYGMIAVKMSHSNLYDKKLPGYCSKNIYIILVTFTFQKFYISINDEVI